jgi:peptidoglycan-associated lipoprotein
MVSTLVTRIVFSVMSASLFFVLPNCSGRTITTSVEDQSMVPGPPKRVVAESPKTEPASPLPPDVAPVPEPPAAGAEPSGPAPEPPATAPGPEPPAPESPLEKAPEPAVAMRPQEEQVTEPAISAPPEPVPPGSAMEVPPPVVARQTEPAVPTVRSTFELGDVFFDFDRATLRNDAKPVLEANAQALKGQIEVKVLIEGHCDERGTSAYNLVLGERRAEAVKRYLQELGIQTTRLETVSYGKERPFCIQHSDDCWQKNRRAHLVLQEQ